MVFDMDKFWILEYIVELLGVKHLLFSRIIDQFLLSKISEHFHHPEVLYLHSQNFESITSYRSVLKTNLKHVLQRVDGRLCYQVNTVTLVCNILVYGSIHLNLSSKMSQLVFL